MTFRQFSLRSYLSSITPMDIINPFLSPTSGLQFRLSPLPTVILSNMLSIKELNQSAEKLFGMRRDSVLDKNFLEISKSRNIVTLLEESVNFILSGNVYELKEKLSIENNQGDLQYKLVCHPISSASALKGISDMIAIVFIPYDQSNEQKSISNVTDNISSAGQSVIKNSSPLNLSSAEVFQLLPATLWWMNSNHIFKGCNIEACRIFGVKSPREFIGRDIFDLGKINDWPQLNMQAFYDGDERVIKTGVSEFNTDVVFPQGKSAPPIRQYGIRKPIFNRQGKVIALMWAGIEIDLLENRFKLNI